MDVQENERIKQEMQQKKGHTGFVNSKMNIRRVGEQLYFDAEEIRGYIGAAAWLKLIEDREGLNGAQMIVEDENGDGFVHADKTIEFIRKRSILKMLSKGERQRHKNLMTYLENGLAKAWLQLAGSDKPKITDANLTHASLDPATS